MRSILEPQIAPLPRAARSRRFAVGSGVRLDDGRTGVVRCLVGASMYNVMPTGANAPVLEHDCSLLAEPLLDASRPVHIRPRQPNGGTWAGADCRRRC